ncbi:hypothetical protein GYMLUDRAFT_906081 [Collybiopsis luxurians FD-317 M1]|uniref:Uncharacterized protein n=1 Tax=Collybiopsis luxurians FD-317 M1 TaxID=944289 RepID=A0A0D0BX03_9AGAR|nr:hypothetical protein GYMLUDRAFT_906081 [Collybiopsis luxurians FD-317 M1]
MSELCLFHSSSIHTLPLRCLSLSPSRSTPTRKHEYIFLSPGTRLCIISNHADEVAPWAIVLNTPKYDRGYP